MKKRDESPNSVHIEGTKEGIHGDATVSNESNENHGPLEENLCAFSESDSKNAADEITKNISGRYLYEKFHTFFILTPSKSKILSTRKIKMKILKSHLQSFPQFAMYQKNRPKTQNAAQKLKKIYPHHLRRLRLTVEIRQIK